MRLFLAVEVPGPIRQGLSRLQDLLSERGVEGVRWTRPAGIHLTLRFCGDVPPEILRLLVEKLSPGAPVPPFHAGLGPVGIFPPKGPPRVLCLRLEEADRLPRLAAWVEERVRSAGVAAERRAFQPHLTLGRFRPGARSVPSDRLSVPEDLLGAELPVERFVLFRSHLEPLGARYEVLQEFPLLDVRAG